MFVLSLSPPVPLVHLFSVWPCPVGWATCPEREAQVWARKENGSPRLCPGRLQQHSSFSPHSSRVTVRNWTRADSSREDRGQSWSEVGDLNTWYLFSLWVWLVVGEQGWGPGHSCWRRSARLLHADRDPGLPSSSSLPLPLGRGSHVLYFVLSVSSFFEGKCTFKGSKRHTLKSLLRPCPSYPVLLSLGVIWLPGLTALMLPCPWRMKMLSFFYQDTGFWVVWFLINCLCRQFKLNKSIYIYI